MTFEMSPDNFKEWLGAITATGGVTLGAWKYGRRISGWCLDRWTSWRNATALRAAEQAEAEKTVRMLNETIALSQLRAAAMDRRYAEAMEDAERKDAEIRRLTLRTEHLEELLDGSRR